jgi:ectoine hydroxylase-related dioxygenase (phytanoyl-CoA dioxygenase family)
VSNNSFPISDQQVREYELDGAIAIRGLLAPGRIEKLRSAVEIVIASPGSDSSEYAKQGEARFVQDMFPHRRQDAAGAIIRDFVHQSPLASVAGRLMRSTLARFLYDQIFVKEPGSIAPTPWHQDQPYWPVQGRQVCSLWCALDPVDLESGAMQYVRGSHRTGKWYRPRHFGGESAYEGAVGEQIPDIGRTVSPGDLLSWSLQPGDAIVFSGLVIHGATGNRSASRRRRAVSIRWVGDDVTYDDRPGTYPFDVAGLEPGQPLDDVRYPVVWRARSS